MVTPNNINSSRLQNNSLRFEFGRGTARRNTIAYLRFIFPMMECAKCALKAIAGNQPTTHEAKQQRKGDKKSQNILKRTKDEDLILKKKKIRNVKYVPSRALNTS